MKKTRIWISGVFSAAPLIALAWTLANPAHAQTLNPDALRAGAFYETNYLSNTVEVFSPRGANLGVLAMPAFPTGLTFDKAGNLYVSSDDQSGYSIQKIAPDGTVSVFANTGLKGPHALAFDKLGNLYVANVS